MHSSESRRPRLREVVGQRPKAARHPVGEPENGRPQPGANASFVIFRQCVDPGEIYIYHHLPISLSTSLPTQLPTYLPIYLPIDLSISSLPWNWLFPALPVTSWPSLITWHCLVPKLFHWSPKAFAWKARPRELRFALGLLRGSVECLSAPLERVPGAPQETLRAILWRRLLLQEWGWPPAQ